MDRDIDCRPYESADPIRSTPGPVPRVRTLGEQRVADVVGATGLAQPNVSAHLSCLWECGLAQRERRGREVHYRLADGVADLLVAADLILDRTGEQVDACENYGSTSSRESAA